MGLVKISELVAAAAITGTETYPIVQSGNTKKATPDSYLLPSDQLLFVGRGPNASDANTGLSWGKPKASVTAAITALGANGGTVQMMSGVHAGFTIPDNVTVRGVGIGSSIEGTGGAIVTITGKAKLTDCQVKESNAAGNAATIGVRIKNGDSDTGPGVIKWALERVFVTGAAAIGGANGTGYLGKGISCEFALEGLFQDCTVEFWNEGIHLEDASNANPMIGCKIRQNVTGVKVVAVTVGPNTHATDINLIGSTIEGNRTGIDSAIGLVQATACHFEPVITSATPPNHTSISLGTSARYMGVANGFYGAAANSDLILASTNNTAHSSVGEIWNAGITNNAVASATLAIMNPVLGPVSIIGTGPSTEMYKGSITGRNVSGSVDQTFSGFVRTVFAHDIHATTGRLLRISASAGQRVTLTDENANDKVSASSVGVGFYGTTPTAKPTVTGSRGGNAALASLLTGLASLGLLTDSTTA